MTSVPSTFCATWQTMRLHQFHHRLVIAERLIRFEHREFGIVPAREAFVAEVAADLEQLVNAADEQALEVKLQRDAQVKSQPSALCLVLNGCAAAPPGMACIIGVSTSM
jgi:trehalose/maltose hydrolase-like predicted phosphorylase